MRAPAPMHPDLKRALDLIEQAEALAKQAAVALAGVEGYAEARELAGDLAFTIRYAWNRIDVYRPPREPSGKRGAAKP